LIIERSVVLNNESKAKWGWLLLFKLTNYLTKLFSIILKISYNNTTKFTLTQFFLRQCVFKFLSVVFVFFSVIYWGTYMVIKNVYFDYVQTLLMILVIFGKNSVFVCVCVIIQITITFEWWGGHYTLYGNKLMFKIIPNHAELIPTFTLIVLK